MFHRYQKVITEKKITIEWNRLSLITIYIDCVMNFNIVNQWLVSLSFAKVVLFGVTTKSILYLTETSDRPNVDCQDCFKALTLYE